MQLTRGIWPGANVIRAYDTPCTPYEGGSLPPPLVRRKLKRHSGCSISVLTLSLFMRGFWRISGACRTWFAPGNRINLVSFRGKHGAGHMHAVSRSFLHDATKDDHLVGVNNMVKHRSASQDFVHVVGLKLSRRPTPTSRVNYFHSGNSCRVMVMRRGLPRVSDLRTTVL
jgi:hypothetical protein